MRTLTDHITNPANDKLTITVTDPPGAGGANHLYEITGFNTESNPSRITADMLFARKSLPILFQNGPVGEVGVNGITNEVLLAIVIDRLRSFQAGPYKCLENEKALFHAKTALEFLKTRTHNRMLRGVEGTHTV